MPSFVLAKPVDIAARNNQPDPVVYKFERLHFYLLFSAAGDGIPKTICAMR